MVLIISEAGDPSTDRVIDWLNYLGTPFFRYNGENILAIDSKVFFQLNDRAVSSNLDACINEKQTSAISAVWFRRDAPYKITEHALVADKKANDAILKNLNHEHQYAKAGFFCCVSHMALTLGNYRRYKINKLETLYLARQQGLNIPATLITNSKMELMRFIQEHGTVITKAIYEGIGFSIDDGENTQVYGNFTEEISPSVLETISDHFFYSLFQEKLDKEIDIRTFFLAGKCYSMAIFSQLDAQTSTDFRKYTNNRNVPFQLPAIIEEKINKLMAKLELNTGSLDFVKTKDNRIVFLEVNPAGQYDVPSVVCNYRLDKKIAEFLTHGQTQ